ncbi:hypothetical protein [Microbacterium sp. P04]|uniref:hypothetical protein n=1 Tax=Microbacterium sp. P04 TaxID=3366947 RepID=UPI0037475051
MTTEDPTIEAGTPVEATTTTDPTDPAATSTAPTAKPVPPNNLVSRTANTTTSPASTAPTADAPTLAARRQRFDRVRLLNEELDRLGTDAAVRTGSVTNKASFLAVSAGVLITAATAQLWDSAPAYGVTSLALASIALATAAIALRPGKRPGIDARRLVDRHLDCDHSVAFVEAEVVRDKADVLTAIERDIASRGRWVWAGFGALAFAAASLAAVFGIETLGG